jgi:hypothetical protein
VATKGAEEPNPGSRQLIKGFEGLWNKDEGARVCGEEVRREKAHRGENETSGPKACVQALGEERVGIDGFINEWKLRVIFSNSMWWYKTPNIGVPQLHLFHGVESVKLEVFGNI